MSETKINTKLIKVIELQRLIEERKALYDEVDRLTLELKNEGFVSAEFEGLRAELVDNFAEGKNVVFRPAAVHRYELKTEPMEKYLKREAKKAKGA